MKLDDDDAPQECMWTFSWKLVFSAFLPRRMVLVMFTSESSEANIGDIIIMWLYVLKNDELYEVCSSTELFLHM